MLPCPGQGPSCLNVHLCMAPAACCSVTCHPLCGFLEANTDYISWLLIHHHSSCNNLNTGLFSCMHWPQRQALHRESGLGVNHLSPVAQSYSLLLQPLPCNSLLLERPSYMFHQAHSYSNYLQKIRFECLWSLEDGSGRKGGLLPPLYFY